jgi:hypothetical protein
MKVKISLRRVLVDLIAEVDLSEMAAAVQLTDLVDGSVALIEDISVLTVKNTFLDSISQILTIELGSK